MAELGSMNVSTTVTPTTSESETSGWSTIEIAMLIISLVTLLGVSVLTILGLCLYHCTNIRGTRQRRIPSSVHLELESLYSDTGTRHRRIPSGERIELTSSYSDTGTVLQAVQEKLQNVYKTLFIPKGQANPPRSIAEIDVELYTELQLLEAIEKSTNEDVATREGKMPVQKPHKLTLDSWRDLLNPEKVKNLMMILLGGAATGKTTLFKKIAHTWTTSKQLSNFKLLFSIELKKMKTSSIIDAILDQCFLRDERPDRDELIGIITDNEKESVFLLDGLDELPHNFLEPSKDDYCVYNVLHKKVLQQSRVLVATRPQKVEDIIKGYPRSLCVEISGFTEENTEQYICKYFRDDESKGRKLIKIMKAMESLRQLARLPVVCQIVCHTFQLGVSQLPDRLMELYRTFMEALARRRCGEDWKKRLETALRVLGRVALDGLLDNRELVLTQKEFDDCAFVLNDASLESGFIQQEPVDDSTVKVTFLYKMFQEYCAAYYFAKYLYHGYITEFHGRLQQINPGNVYAMEYLLRFACGISSYDMPQSPGSPTIGIILEHVQKQRAEGRWRDEVKLQKLVRLMLFESGYNEMANKLDRPTHAECDSHEDLLAMRYYLKCLHQPLVGLEEFSVHCKSHKDLALLTDITVHLRDNTRVSIRFRATCRSHGDLVLLREMLLSGYIKPVTGIVAVKPFRVTYIMSEQANEEMQTLDETLVGMNEGLRDQIELEVEINEMSHFDDESVLASLSRVCNQIEDVTLRNRTYEDVIRLANALDGCDRLGDVTVSNTNLHGRLVGVASLVSRSLSSLTLDGCGLNDDDVPDLISILPAGHGLRWLVVPRNEFSLSGVTKLTAHLQRLPQLRTFWLDYSGPDAEHVTRVVKQNLPKVNYV